MSIFDRNRLDHALTIPAADELSPVDYDDRDFFDADATDFHLRQAA